MRLSAMLAVVALLDLSSGASCAAQSANHARSADSAAAARAEWQSAMTFLRGNDLASARGAMDRAEAMWPSQPAYVWARAVLAARAGDTLALLDALRDYDALGLGRDLSDTTFNQYRALPDFRAIADAHGRNRQVLSRSRVHLTLSDSTLWPEGMDVDRMTGTTYVASVRHRTIVAVHPDGRQRELVARGAAGIGAVMGVRVDPRRRALWATAVGLRQMEGWLPGDTLAFLMRINLESGAIERRWTLDPSRPHVPGDLAIATDGTVLVTDSRSPSIHRLRPGIDTLETITHPLFRSLQGIAEGRPGVAYVADYSHGLLRINLATLEVRRLAHATGITTLGVDGIALHGDAIIAVQNGVAPARVMRFQLDGSGERIVAAEILDRNWEIADEPTIGAIVSDTFIYVANSQWEKYDDEGRRRPGTTLRGPVLLALPLSAGRATRPASGSETPRGSSGTAAASSHPEAR